MSHLIERESSHSAGEGSRREPPEEWGDAKDESAGPGSSGVVRQVAARRMAVAHAAELLRLSSRHVYRIVERFGEG